MENIKDYKNMQKELYKEICSHRKYTVYKVDNVYKYKKCCVCGHKERKSKNGY